MPDEMHRPDSFAGLGQREPVFKNFQMGTHRQVDPAATFARIKPLLGNFGITRIANVTGLDRIGIPVIMVCRPNARSVSVSQGKGLTLDAARVSGVMESIELWHAEHMVSPVRLASARKMEEIGRVVALDRLPHRARSRFHRDLPLLWISGHDLFSHETMWLPYECVTMNSTLPLPTGSGCFLGTSNGLASGNDLLEATSHAICELVERDATALWQASGRAETPDDLIDLDTVDDWACRLVIDRCRAAGVEILAWDITSDVGLPVFVALITELKSLQPIRSTAMGYGCHNDRGIALLRALTEAIQSRLTYISGSRDDLFRNEYEDNLRTRASIDRCHGMLAARPSRSFQQVRSLQTDTFDGDVEIQLDRLRQVGCSQIVAVDLTDPQIGLPVVRIVVAGLEGPDSDPDYVMGARAIAAQELS